MGRKGHSNYLVWVCARGGDFQFQTMWSAECSVRKVAFEQRPEGTVKEGAMQRSGERTS